eukprot:7363526-Prorocentrum_lima.AAC.1
MVECPPPGLAIVIGRAPIVDATVGLPAWSAAFVPSVALRRRVVGQPLVPRHATSKPLDLRPQAKAM